MKKVKADIRLRKKMIINRWIETGGYFSILIERGNIFLSSEITNTTLVQMIFPLIQKFNILGQIAYMFKFFKLNYLYAIKVIANTDSGYLRFCSAISSDYNQILVRCVENKFHSYIDFCRNTFKISNNYGKNNSETY